jgi:hypothetical protein
MTIVEMFVWPLVFMFAYFLNFGLFTKKDTPIGNYFNSQDFYQFVFYLTIVVGTYISLCSFVNFHIPREKDINVASTLEIMNVSRFSSDLSFILIQ